MPLMTEEVSDVAIPPARMQLGSGLRSGFGGEEYLEAGLGYTQTAEEEVCPFGFDYLVRLLLLICFLTFLTNLSGKVCSGSPLDSVFLKGWLAL